PRLPEVKPYRHYIQWLENRDQEASANYWRSKLEGYGEPAAIPKLSAENNPKEYRPGTYAFESVGGNNGEIARLAAANQVTLNMLIQTLWGLIPAKYNSTRDVVFGLVVAGRPYEIEGIETMVGLFINTIPVRIRYRRETIKQLLAKVRHNALEREPHENYPLAKIQAATQLKQNLLDHILIFENYPVAGQMKGVTNLDVTHLDTFEQTNYDFNVTLLPGAGTVMRFDYNAAMYTEPFVRRIAGHFNNHLGQILENREIEIDTLNHLTETEKHHIIREFNDTHRETPLKTCYSRLFEKQVRKKPTKIAARHNDSDITYERLDREANHIAHQLLGKGNKNGSVIGIYQERSIPQLTTIIGIFKAGCAYMPIETDYPPDRIKKILEDSSVTQVIATTAERETIENIKNNQPTLQEILYSDSEEMTGQRSDAPETKATAEDLAYIIYTSGSTGKPKGIMIHQAGMINHLYAKINDLEITAQDNIAQTASVSFDISVWQYLAAPLTGGRTTIIDKETVLEAAAYLRELRQQKITVLESVPSLMTAFLEQMEQQKEKQLPHLRWMLSTGEALTVSLAKEWKKHFPGIPLVNAYGPTEASDDITHYKVPGELPPNRNSIPIGKPLQNLHIYIMDKELKLCPVGVSGEICVAGVGVGKGYWKDEEKTRSVFLTNPYAGEIQTQNADDYKKLYKTGDIGYFEEDGTIRYLGRIDHQVKIRGNRIEMGEIESRLKTHQNIVDAVVLNKEDTPGHQYLAAYIVPAATAANTINAAHLGEYLAQELPVYMIPTTIMQLEKLPLAPSGKVDRKKLATYGETNNGEKYTAGIILASSEKYAAPENENEKIIAAAWQEVLKLEKVGRNDNFFEIGGNSIDIIKVSGRLRTALKKEMPVALLFRYPTVQTLGEYLKQEKNSTQKETTAPPHQQRDKEADQRGKNRMKNL
ncbi:MAG: amino acid adenylation domain-containing protein, partial [bacterium]|nr:amino acid adenylation domain-containing protein [bacterium]